MANEGFWKWPEEIYIVASRDLPWRMKYRIYTSQHYAEKSMIKYPGELYVLPIPPLSELKRIL